MAKTVAPLFAVSASGTLADTLVFSRWKGVKYVRQYVIPANPNTGSQQSQRSKMTQAVNDWHGTSFTPEDITSLNRWATYAKAAMSGFNKFVRESILVQLAGNSWSVPEDLAAVNTSPTHFTIRVKQASNVSTLTADLYYGYEQGFMPLNQTMTWNAVTQQYESTVFTETSRKIVYARVRLHQAGADGWLGNLRYQVT